jgi:hypothetical protein
MAIIYAEGFDDGIMRGATGGADAPTASTDQPRTGTHSLKTFLNASGAFDSSFYSVSHAALATGWVYVAVYLPAAPAATARLVALLDTATVHVTLDLGTDRKLIATRNGTALATGSFVLPTSAWTHLAIKATIADAAGAVEVRINGSPTPDIDESSVDTRNGGNASWDVTRIGWFSGGNMGVNTGVYHDDLVIQDTTGSAPENDWLGDVECRYSFPDAAGDEQDFTVAGSRPPATAWESLDEVPADDAVTLIESNTPTDQVLLNYGAIAAGGTIYAVIPLLRALKDGAGARSIAPREKLGTTVRNGADIALSTSWVTYQGDVWHRDPDGSVWTTSSVNSSQAGAEVTV